MAEVRRGMLSPGSIPQEYRGTQEEVEETQVETPTEERRDPPGILPDATQNPWEELREYRLEEKEALQEPTPEPLELLTPEEIQGIIDEDPDRPLMHYSTHEVQSMYEHGYIDADDADMYIALKELDEFELLGMSQESVQRLWQEGILDEGQVDAYLRRHESPISFYLGEIPKAVIGGTQDALKWTTRALGDALKSEEGYEMWRKHYDQVGVDPEESVLTALRTGEFEAQGKDIFDAVSGWTEENANWLYRLNKNMTTVYSQPGGFLKTMSQFMVPFTHTARLGRMTTAGSFVRNQILNTSRMKKLAESHPGTAQFLARISEDTVRGAITDYAVFDPYMGRLADMLNEWDPDTQNVVLDYLATDEDNPAVTERLKNTLEGGILGVVSDGLMSGLRATKGQLWRTVGSDKEQAVRTVNELKKKHGFKGPDPLETQVDLRTDTVEGAKRGTDRGRRLDPQVDDGRASVKPDVSEGPPRDRVTPKATEEELQTTGEWFLRHRDEKQVLPDTIDHNRFLEMMETPEGSIRIAKHIREARVKDLEAMKVADVGADVPVGRTVKRSTTEREASKKLGQLLGESTETTMDAMRNLFGEAESLPVRIRALNKFFVTYLESVDRALQDSSNMTFRQKVRVMEHMKNVQEIEAIVFGVRSQIGRSLDVYNYNMRGLRSRFDALDIMEDLDYVDLQRQSEHSINQAIEMFKSGKNHTVKMATTRNVGEGGVMRGLLEMVQANLLWNPATHITNMVGTSIALANNSLKRFAALRMHSLITRNPEVMKEWQAYKHGMRIGALESLRLPGVTRNNFYNPVKLGKGLKKAWDMDSEAGRMWKALFSGELQLDPRNKIEGQSGTTYQKLDAKAVKALDRLGMNTAGVRMPLRALIKLPFLPFNGLSAVDEFTKNLGYFSELHAGIYRKGLDRGLQGKQLEDFAGQMLNSKRMPRDLHYQAIHKGREVTFTEDLGRASGKLNEFLNANAATEGLKIAGVPFYKVIVNLARYAGRNSPLGIMSSSVRKQLRAGGRERYEAITGMLAGTGAVLGAGALYSNGLMTGRVPPNMYDSWSNYGVQDYSIKFGDRWVSYVRLDPLATLLGVTADAFMASEMIGQYLTDPDEADDFQTQVMLPVILAFSEPILNKTFMKSLNDLADVLLQPERKDLGHFGRNQMAKFVPGSTALNHITNITDDTVRETNRMIDVIYQRIPSKSRELLPKRHSLYGTEIERDPAWPIPLLGIYTQREETGDPVAAEWLRLGIPADPPSDTITIDHASVELEPEEYDRLNRLIADMPVQETLTRIIQSNQYQRLDRHTQAQVLRNTRNDFRNAARQVLIAGSDRVKREIIEELRKRAEIRAGMQEEAYPEGDILRWLE